MGAMEGRDLRHIGQRYQDMYRPALIANWQVWPVAQVSNFTTELVPNANVFLCTAGELPLHATPIPCALPVDMRCVLDALSLATQRKVRSVCDVPSMCDFDSCRRESEVQERNHNLRRTVK